MLVTVGQPFTVTDFHSLFVSSHSVSLIRVALGWGWRYELVLRVLSLWSPRAVLVIPTEDGRGEKKVA